MNESFAKTVWDTLSAVDCSPNVEKKGNLSYLSWANAWTALMEVYPESSFAFLEDSERPDGTVEVHTSVTVREGEREMTRQMSLPVMDYKNTAVPGPTSREVSDNRMRCLVKNIALFGLGLFLYRGEDIPKTKKASIPATQEQRDEIQRLDKEKKLSPRRVAYLDAPGKWESLTESAAQTIIDEAKEIQ